MEIRVLGPLEVVSDDGAVVALGGRQRRLLAALVVGRGEVCSADSLIEAVWDRSPPVSPGKALQVNVSRLRKALPDGIRIRTAESGYALACDGEALDATRFERLVGEARAGAKDGNAALAVSLLDRAESLWHGHAYGELAYEEFARAEAERLEELRLLAVEEEIEAELTLGRHARLLPRLGGLVAAHPVRERMCGQLMLALYRCGRQTEALQAFTSIRLRLHDELGLQLGADLRELQRRILQHDPNLAVGVAAEEPSTELPSPPNELLGRQRELGELGELLQRDRVRLVVLTGAGGSGKTRLALELARRTATSFANGAAVADLAPVRSAALVPGAIAAALGIEGASGDEGVKTLAAALRPQELLLLIDNAEHVREAAPGLVELLRQAPRLKLLVTSRVVLHVSGEHVYPVEPLAAEAAFALFMERAFEAEARYRPEAADEEVVRRICDRLEGLPLAIELAASWIRTLSPRELLGQLERSVPLLTGGPRDLPARQQTIRATVDWSLDLLDEDERRDLCRLSVFAGGWTLEAAEAVCGTSAQRLSSLVDHSLVRRINGLEDSRYSMLETVREVAFEALERLGEAPAVRDRHVDFLLRIGEAVDGAPWVDRGPRMERLRPELDNLRVAMLWALESDAERALRLGWVAAYFQAAPRERLGWLEQGLARVAAPSRRVRARALHCLAFVTGTLGDFERAGESWHGALVLYRELGDDAGSARALAGLGFAAAEQGQVDDARALYEQSLAVSRRIADSDAQWLVLNNLGELERVNGQRGRAVELYESARQVATDSGDLGAAAMSLHGLADIAREEGNLALAAGRYQESIAITHELAGGGCHICWCLAGLASIAGASKAADTAGALWGAAESLEEQTGVPLPPTVRADYREPLDQLDPDLVALATERGRALAVEDAVDFALGLDTRSFALAAP